MNSGRIEENPNGMVINKNDGMTEEHQSQPEVMQQKTHGLSIGHAQIVSATDGMRERNPVADISIADKDDRHDDRRTPHVLHLSRLWQLRLLLRVNHQSRLPLSLADTGRSTSRRRQTTVAM